MDDSTKVLLDYRKNLIKHLRNEFPQRTFDTKTAGHLNINTLSEDEWISFGSFSILIKDLNLRIGFESSSARNFYLTEKYGNAKIFQATDNLKILEDAINREIDFQAKKEEIVKYLTANKFKAEKKEESTNYSPTIYVNNTLGLKVTPKEMAYLDKKNYIEGINSKDNLRVEFDIEKNGLQKLKETIEQRQKNLNTNSKKETNHYDAKKSEIQNGTDDNKKEATHWAHKAKFIAPLVPLIATIISLIVLQFALAALTLSIGIGVGLAGVLLAGGSFFTLDNVEKNHTKGNPATPK